MNGLHITGMKLSSPAPTKKTNNSVNQVKTNQSLVGKPPAKKTTVPTSQLSKGPAIQKKQPIKKVEQKNLKKQQPKKVLAKSEEAPKIEAKMEKQEPAKIEQIKKQEQKVQPSPIEYQVMVRYNHYKQKFPCVNGVLSFSVPNQKYCFGLVFKGNYQPILRNFKSRQIIEPLTAGKAEEFSWKVNQNQVYEVQIQEDEDQQAKYERHAYKAPEKPQQCAMKKNHRAQQLTEQMKRMGVNELGSEKHKQLLEQRDLEDILFS